MSGVASDELCLDKLPAELPQTGRLREVATNLWKRDDVVALWLGGSFADETADRYSDIDLRVAVPPESIAHWKALDERALCDILGRPCLAHERGDYGPFAILHHTLLADGDIYDLFVQSTEHEKHEHSVLILGCRDATFAVRLKAFATGQKDVDPTPADGEEIAHLIRAFWFNTHKHRKVFARGLDLLSSVGINVERAMLLRLWYASITGLDGGEARPNIFALSERYRVVRRQMGARAMQILGAPLSSREHMIVHIEQLRNEVGAVGRQLAGRLGFEYPEQLEAMVRESWEQFESDEKDKLRRDVPNE